MSLSISQTLLCAAGAAYNIGYAPGIGPTYTADSFYNPQLAWLAGPMPFAGGPDYIDACFVGQNALGVIVSARGTLFSGTGYLDDWLNDFWEEPTVWGYPQDSGILFPGKVHSGFWQAVLNVYAGVVEQVKTLLAAAHTPPAVYVTGHSKGGGMAPLLAYLFHLDGIKVAQVVTFAAPKAGNTGFQQTYTAVFSTNHTRYENYGDLVPFLWPTSSVAIDILTPLAALFASWWPSFASDIEAAEQWDYQPVGTELYIDGYNSISPSSATQGADLLLNLVENLDTYSVEQILLLAHTIAGCVPFTGTPVAGYLSAVYPGLKPAACPMPLAGALPQHA